MRRSVGLTAPATNNPVFSALLSLSLSAALVLIPVLPARAAVTSAAPAGGLVAAAAPTRAASAATTAAAPLAAPSLVATKTDSFPDPDGDGKAEPGQTITYTVTVTNNGPDDATNVQFSDTVDPNTTLVPGSVRTQPVASGDSYSVLGNVRIQVPDGASDLLANDCDPDNGGPCSSAGLTASGPTTSAQGGNVVVNANGSFSYNPPAGFEGTDTFTYTVSDGTSSDTATATLNVGDAIWFVDNTAGASGDGRLTSPYNSLAPLNGPGGGGDPDETSDVIFVHEGAPSSSYGGGIVLEDGQRLVGQGMSLDVALSGFGVTVPPHSDARPAATGNPTITNAAGNAVTLANGNAVYAVNASTTAAASAAVSGSGVGGATLAGVNVSAGGASSGISLANLTGPVSVSGGSVVANSSGAAVAVGGGAANVVFTNTTVSQNGGRVVDVQGRSGGAVHFAGASTVTGTAGATDAVVLTGNAAAASVTFSAALSLSTSAAGARGLVADGGFTLNVATGSISATGGAAVDIENISANIDFSTTFSTNSTGNGVSVENVSGTASFGDTTVTNSAGTGVVISDSVGAVAFTDLDITPAAGQRALHATNNAGKISSTRGVVSATNATAIEIAGAGAASRTPIDVRLTSVSASGGANGILLLNTSAAAGSSGFRVTGTNVGVCTFADTSGCTGGTISGTTGSDGATAGAGVRLDNADSVVLARMHIHDHPNFAVRGTNVDGFVLDASVVGGANGTTAGAPFNEGSVSFDGGGSGAGLSGASAITNSDVRGGFVNNLRVANTAGTLGLSVSGSTFANNGDAAGGDSVFVDLASTATAFVGFTGSTFAAARGNHLAFRLTNMAVGHLTFTGNTLSGGHAVGVGQGIIMSGASWSGVGRYNISNNTMTGTNQGGAIFANKGTGAGDMQGTISGNTIGNPLVANSGTASSSGIRVESRGNAGRHTAVVSNNQIHQFNNGQGIELVAGEDGGPASNTNLAAIGPASALDITVTGNTITTPGPLAMHAIHLNSGVLPGDNNQVCADIGGIGAANNVQTGGNEAAGFFDIRPRQRQATRVQLPGYVGTAFDNTSVGAYITARNNLSSVSATSQNVTATANDGFFGGLACQQPAAPTAPTAPSLASATTEANGAGAQLAAASGFSADRGFVSSLDKYRRFGYTGRAELLRAAPVAGGLKVDAPRAAAAPVAMPSGETVNVQIGTLRAGDSVTITFQATVANSVPAGTTQASNQGAVTADGGTSVQTDDPDTATPNDPTVTPLLLPPTIRVNDATAVEPATGSANMLFTVTLAYPYTQAVSVNYQTADTGSATAGEDYAATSGTVTFNAGQTVKTVSVPVLTDGIAGEGGETFAVNLSSPVVGAIGDGNAAGTITDESVASAVIISELRTSGPGGAGDDFVELLNTTDGDVTVAAGGWALVASGAACTDTPSVVATIPAGAVIPARGHYLLRGSAYSLAAYAAGDQTLSSDIADDRNVALFSTGDLAGIGSANRLDAVGFGSNTTENCELLREGTNLSAAAGSTSEYSFVRKVTKGLTVDTTDNAADFALVSTTPSVPVGEGAPTLGAPGPEGSADERGPVPCSATTGAPKFGRDLIDPAASAADAPNVARDNTAVANGALGTLDFRRTFTNNTGASVNSLRFRVTNRSGAADLRALGSTAIVVATAGGNKTVEGTTVETPPAQASGGGLNSSLAAGAVTLAQPLAAGASVNLRFRFGVEQAGDYDLGFVIESSPVTSGKDFWRLTGHTETGGHTDAGCNRPPVANAGPDQEVECSAGQASVLLDGSASADPDGDTPLTYEWKEGATVLGAGVTLNAALGFGSHAITLTVTDPSGDSSQDTVTVVVDDDTAPQVTPPPNVVAYTGPGATSCGANVNPGTATAADSCEGTLTATGTRGDNLPLTDPYPVGLTTITWTATDGSGNPGSAQQTVTVIDNTAPTVTAPNDVTEPSDPDSCSANVNPGTATADDNCPGVQVAGARSDNQPLDAPYPVGATTITWTATDAAGNTATDTQTVTVQDTQAPTLLSSVAVALLGSPFNHALINVGLSATASDNCPGLGAYQVSVFSDEDDGTGPHSPDAANVGLGTLRLRRERDGAGNGRVYLVVVKVTDAYGNTTASCSTVGVPQSNTSSSVASVNAQAAAAASFCSANSGAAPAGFFAVGP